MTESVINIHEEWIRTRLYYRDEFRRARRFFNKGIIDETEYIAAHRTLLREISTIYSWYKGMTKQS